MRAGSLPQSIRTEPARSVDTDRVRANGPIVFQRTAGSFPNEIYRYYFVFSRILLIETTLLISKFCFFPPAVDPNKTASPLFGLIASLLD